MEETVYVIKVRDGGKDFNNEVLPSEERCSAKQSSVVIVLFSINFRRFLNIQSASINFHIQQSFARVIMIVFL